MNNDCAILIFSCDNYSDLWKPLIDNYNKMWKDCSLPIYILTNTKEIDDSKVKSLCIGMDTTWSSNAIKALKKIDEKYILTTFDDLFLGEEVDNTKIMNFVKKAITNEFDYLRLNPTPAPDVPYDDDIGLVKSGAIYRSSCVFALWKKEVLLDILDDKENAWQHEIYGCERTDKYEKWFATYKPSLKFINLVVKGKYYNYAYNELVKLGVDLPNKRNVMCLRDLVQLKIAGYREQIMYKLIPKCLMRKYQRLCYKLNFKY